MKSGSKRERLFVGIRTVFLDRDGVINRKPPEGKYIGAWSDFEVLPGVEEAIGRLNRSGYNVLVVSNQRGIALGLYTVEAVLQLHKELQAHLKRKEAHIDGFYFCPHDNSECTCRKPGTGLFEQARLQFPGIDPETSVIIGDSLSDIEAGRRFGCRTIFVTGNADTRKPGTGRAIALADATVGSLAEAVDALSG
jgi:D-glycero-D-manno-heptose 1,7-bisphosphate phosphatase